MKVYLLTKYTIPFSSIPASLLLLPLSFLPLSLPSPLLSFPSPRAPPLLSQGMT